MTEMELLEAEKRAAQIRKEGTWICADELIQDFKEYMKGE